MTPERNIVVSHRFDLPAEHVCNAWLDPVLASRFLFATDGGEMIRLDIDARVGGSYTITERRGADEVEHTGQYLKIERPKKLPQRLAFTLGSRNTRSVVALVSVHILPRPDGCELFLTQESGQHTTEEKEQIAHGWTTICERLSKLLLPQSSLTPPPFHTDLTEARRSLRKHSSRKFVEPSSGYNYKSNGTNSIVVPIHVIIRVAFEKYSVLPRVLGVRSQLSRLSRL